MAAQAHDAVVQYPGGLRARYRWAGSGQGRDAFALTEAGVEPVDHGPLVSATFERLCRAEVHVESPSGAWTARFASPVFEEPSALLWDTPGLLVVKYGFLTYGFEARTGHLRWTHRSPTPVLAVLGSSRFDHVIVQSEIETFAVDADGAVAWRVAHSDVVSDAELVAGHLVLRSYSGLLTALDPATGRTTP